MPSLNWQIIFALSLGISAGNVLLLILSEHHLLKFRTNILAVLAGASQMDAMERWVQMVEKRIKKTNIKIKAKLFIAVSLVSCVIGFLVSLTIFKNLTASLFLGGAFLIIPEHVLTIIEKKQRDKVYEQMVAAIRIFSAEFIQTPQLEKGFAAVAAQIGDPVGRNFNDAYQDLIVGTKPDLVLASLMAKLDFEHGRMFVQLLDLARIDHAVSYLFPELLSKIESQIELSRKNVTNLTGERMLALIMVCIPVPVYFWFNRLVPETEYFVTQTFLGRAMISMAFLSILVWAIMDRVIGRVEG